MDPLPSCSILHLADSDLSTMPDVSWSTAAKLQLENNDIRVLFSEYLPVGIKTLHAGFNRIHTDGLPFEWPASLENIHLDHNSIHDTDGIRWPESLQQLSLHSNPLQYWPPALPENLKVLSLSKTDLREVESLPQGLKQLFIRCARVRQLPTSLPEGLEILIASNNFLRSSRLPQHWGCSLQQLNLSRNSLTSFPKGLPDTLKILWLDENKITELPSDLPTNLTILFLRKNNLRKVAIEKRTKPLSWVCLDDNELTESVNDYQVRQKIQWAHSIFESENWTTPNHHDAQKKICLLWRRYRLRKRVRTLRKTSIVREELQQVSMHPCRAGRFENISNEWGWGC